MFFLLLFNGAGVRAASSAGRSGVGLMLGVSHSPAKEFDGTY
jgi:hypothetical protein